MDVDTRDLDINSGTSNRNVLLTPTGASSTNADDPAIDPERIELEDNVRIRDERVMALEKARMEKQEELKMLQKEFEEEKLNQMIEQLIHKIESDRLKKQTTAVTIRLETLEKDMSDKAAIHEYATLIKGVAPKQSDGVDAQYVTKLNNQLAKAVKKMESTTISMTEIENNCDETVSTLRKDIAELVQDRCRTEIELRKQLDILIDQKKEMMREYDHRIRDNQIQLEKLKEKAEREKLVPKENLEAELSETETRLSELQRIHETQAKTLKEMNHDNAFRN